MHHIHSQIEGNSLMNQDWMRKEEEKDAQSITNEYTKNCN
ncbi:hypothetical protein JOD20_002987 [Herpetosiphon giganteus]|nr:hypothetical protein [Herpetosiphon giganteus]